MPIRRFIGGFNPTSALNTLVSLQNKGLNGILDYAKESSKHPNDVSHYHRVMQTLFYQMHAMSIDKNSTDIAIALKYSSFTPSENPAESMHALIQEFCTIAPQPVRKHVFIDAEHPHRKQREDAIHATLLNLIRNDPNLRASNLITYRTIQAYRRDALELLATSVDEASAGGIQTGVKLVRGAYHTSSLPDVLYQRIEDTHTTYNTAAFHLITAVTRNDHLYACIATHNTNSVTKAIQHLSAIQPPPSATNRISFAQLLGMADHLSSTSRDAGYQTFKYLPFGPLKEIAPYLSRRIVENYPLIKHITV